jgi:hypothetical protein
MSEFREKISNRIKKAFMNKPIKDIIAEIVGSYLQRDTGSDPLDLTQRKPGKKCVDLR